MLENNTLDPVANYIQQVAVDVSSSIDPMTAMYVGGPIGDHLSNVTCAGAAFLTLGCLGFTAIDKYIK